MALRERRTSRAWPGGAFAAWEKEGLFDRVKLGHHGQLEWP
jgi:hypothetical protein